VHELLDVIGVLLIRPLDLEELSSRGLRELAIAIDVFERSVDDVEEFAPEALGKKASGSYGKAFPIRLSHSSRFS